MFPALIIIKSQSSITPKTARTPAGFNVWLVTTASEMHASCCACHCLSAAATSNAQVAPPVGTVNFSERPAASLERLADALEEPAAPPHQKQGVQLSAGELLCV